MVVKWMTWWYHYLQHTVSEQVCEQRLSCFTGCRADRVGQGGGSGSSGRPAGQPPIPGSSGAEPIEHSTVSRPGGGVLPALWRHLPLCAVCWRGQPSAESWDRGCFRHGALFSPLSQAPPKLCSHRRLDCTEDSRHPACKLLR